MTDKQFKHTQVMRGKGKLPVADYTLATNILDSLTAGGTASGSSGTTGGSSGTAGGSSGGAAASGGGGGKQAAAEGVGGAEGVVVGGGEGSRGVYSFCMCPGAFVGYSSQVKSVCVSRRLRKVQQGRRLLLHVPRCVVGL